MIVNFEEIEAKDKNKKVLDFLLKKIDMYAEKSNGKDVNLIIDNYQYDCFRMEDEELLPFVLLEGKIEWNVPIKDIRIREIINTFSEDNTQGIEFHFQSRYGIGDRDYDLKKIRRQSLIYWKKYAKEWGMPRKNIQKIARETRKFLYQFPVSPQVLIKSVFCVFSTTIEVRTFQDVYNIRVKDKNKIRSFLKFLGYQQKEKDIYWRVDERIENIKQLCSLCEEYMRIANNKNFYLSSRVKLTVANVFRNISNKFQNIAEKIDLRWSANAYPIEPANGERESKITTFIMFFSIIVMLVISVGGIIFVIKELRNIVTLDQLSLWGSSSGFLGDIVGSIIAGITTIATTYFIVHKNDKIDFHQERMKILPVFQLVYKRNTTLQLYP